MPRLASAPSIPILALVAALAALTAVAATAEDTVCSRVTLEYGDIDGPVVGFAWAGVPSPIAQGIMFETLMDRPAGDSDFVVAVQPDDCYHWDAAVTAGLAPLEIRFYGNSNQLLATGRGRASVERASCDGSVKKVLVKVDSSFNIGMPPA